MDHFGIGAALEGAAVIYFRSARRSGRTTSLVESLKTGDRVVFLEAREADRVKRLCMERGVKIEVTVLDPKRPGDIFHKNGSLPAEGRMLFDHGWLEAFYLFRLREAANLVDDLQRNLSGYGAAHRETKRRAEELARWRN